MSLQLWLAVLPMRSRETRRRLPCKPKSAGCSGAKAISLPVPACGETTQKVGSNDPNDPVDGTVNKTITDWLAAGNKAAWKSSFGLDRPALGDAKSEIDTSGYGKDLFLTAPEAKTRGIDPHRKQILPHRGLFDNSKGILENTISAADNALRQGFHGVELDLRADRSGHAWMMHALHSAGYRRSEQLPDFGCFYRGNQEHEPLDMESHQ
ncbi:glycerophosphodiester phosphodiesterase family protein [Bradyrhizobium sp. RT9a]|uniref:glycerophosphodiester phosphodiesterase family protein n=1 Tax=Bradyrhizobium sp. RT9a TaxID=3156384 RepID=UPI003390B4D1